MCGEVVSRRGQQGRAASLQDLVPGFSVGMIGVHWAGVRFVCQCQSSVDSILGSRTNLMAGPVHILDIQIPSTSRRCRPTYAPWPAAWVLLFWEAPSFPRNAGGGVTDIPSIQASRCLHLNSRGSSFSARYRHVVAIVNRGPHTQKRVYLIRLYWLVLA